MHKILPLVVIPFFMLSQTSAFGQLGNQSPGTTGADFLKIGVGARQVAMGGAFAGVADDATALYWNPGGLGYVNRWNVTMAVNRWLFDTRHASIMATTHRCFLGYQRTAVGGGVIWLGMPEWNSTEDPNAQKGSASDFAGMLSVGQRIDWLTRHLSVGFTGKLIHRKLMERTSNGLGFDAGVMFRAGGLKAGLAVTDYTLRKIRFIDEEFNLPTTLRGGISYKIPAYDLLVAAGVSDPIDNTPRFHFGFEKWIRGLALRGGYKLKTENTDDIGVNKSGLTAGFGLRWGIWQFDYAFANSDKVANDVLDVTHQLSVSLRAPDDVDPFSLKSPPENIYCSSDSVPLSWEPTFEHDWDRPATFFVVMDSSHGTVESSISSYEGISRLDTAGLKEFRKKLEEIDPLYFKELKDSRICFHKQLDINEVSSPQWKLVEDDPHREDEEVVAVVQPRDALYWTVLAQEEETGLGSVCKQRVGKFTFQRDTLLDFHLESPRDNDTVDVRRLTFTWSKTRLDKGSAPVHYILLLGSHREHVEEAHEKFMNDTIGVNVFISWMKEQDQMELLYEMFVREGSGSMTFALPKDSLTMYSLPVDSVPKESLIEGESTSSEKGKVFKEIVEVVMRYKGRKLKFKEDGQLIYWSVLAYEEVCGSRRICKEGMQRVVAYVPPDQTFGRIK